MTMLLVFLESDSTSKSPGLNLSADGLLASIGCVEVRLFELPFRPGTNVMDC
jgi:hypothetical protein